MSQEENTHSADKRKVSPEAADEPNAKRPAIAGLLDPSLTCRFLHDPIIGHLCDRLAENQPLVQTAQQLLKALQDARFENGSLNDDALKHFALVLQVWRNLHFRSELYDVLNEQERVLTTIIEELSNQVEDEPIEERMSRIKGDQNLKHILEVTKPADTMMRGLVIILIGYWSYKKLPLKLGEENGCDVVEEKVDNDSDFEKRIQESEEQDRWLMEHGSPIQILEQEPSIKDMADDFKRIPHLVKTAERCMASLHSFDPQDDGTLCYAKEHCDLVHEVLKDTHLIHLLVERIKLDSYFCAVVQKYAERALVQNAESVVNNIIKDPGFNLYKERNDKKEVDGALRIFLSILIVHWIDKDVYEKVHKELVDYAQAQAAAAAVDKIAKSKDNITAEIKYSTRFAGDLKDLKAVLDEIYGTTPHGHMFDELKIMQFEREVIARQAHYDIEMDVKARLRNGTCPIAYIKLRYQ